MVAVPARGICMLDSDFYSSASPGSTSISLKIDRNKVFMVLNINI